MKFSLLTCLFLVSVQFAFAQQKIPKKKVMKPLPEIKVRGVQMCRSGYVYSTGQFLRDVTKSRLDKDKKIISQYAYLQDSLLNSQNIDYYYDLACSYWNLNQIESSETLFMKIYNSDSTAKVASRTSLVRRGESHIKILGHGSYLSTLMKDVCIYLCKINIENKKYDTALKFLDAAKNDYKIFSFCGTGMIFQDSEYDLLTGLCLEGMGKYNEALDLLAPTALTHIDEITIRIIKKKYANDQIQKELQKAIDSIVLPSNENKCYPHRSNNSTDNTTTLNAVTYYSSSFAYITFYNRKYKMPGIQVNDPTMDNKFIHIAKFKQTYFYRKLVD
jgi:tetratricopeptide (TPR) repeat protein